jgi:hypothetical protein
MKAIHHRPFPQKGPPPEIRPNMPQTKGFLVRMPFHEGSDPAKGSRHYYNLPPSSLEIEWKGTYLV